jgi:hypothetical protein
MVLELPRFDLSDFELLRWPNDLPDLVDLFVVVDLAVGALDSLRIAADKERINDSSLSLCVDSDITSAIPEYPLKGLSPG